MNYTRHKTKWKNCERCDLCHGRMRTVLLRGTLPADILVVGEAPGTSENVLGRPFVGPAGKLLDRMLNETCGDLRLALTNLVACIPLDDGQKATEPPKYAIEECAPRLGEVFRMAKPQLVVRVGKLSAKHFEPDCPCVDIIHPAAILRMDVSQQGLAYQRAIVAIHDAIEEHVS